ncbi:MAG: hypothetical protein KIG49_00600 [Eubacteriales bacterium]|nr:hypothetical protein [Eubacteriales bacterium]
MLDNLYENIGGKIKNCAKGIFIIEAIGSIIAGLVLLFTDEDLILYGLLTLVCGQIVAWVGSWILYAFGELVEDTHAIRNEYYPIINDIKKNVRLMADPIIREAEEKARREAEEKARREAEEKARRETPAKVQQTIQKKEKTLSEKLAYALMFQSDDGMVRYLKGLQDETVQNILKSPQHLIREQIKNLLEHM